MTANPHLVPQLEAFVALDQPGLALMIDAPWGAGKTFALKQWLTGKNYSYVSLFGVTSREEVEEALFQALADKQDLKVPSGLPQAIEGIAKKFTGATVDLTSLYRQQVMKGLPKLLVFDDLERAQMAPPVLLAALNRYVEHDGRQVILIADESELEKTCDYRRWREKVVGRTVTLVAETDSAIEYFLSSLPDSAGRVFLKAEKDLLRDTFARTESANLRLLRQVVVEFARFYGQLPLQVSKHEKGMRVLLADFTALSVTYHAGEGFGRDDLLQPSFTGSDRWKMGGRKGDKPAETGFEKLRKRFVSFPFTCLDGTVLPGELAQKLIADGYASSEEVAKRLGETALFRNEDGEPWITLWWWQQCPDEKVEVALRSVQDALAKQELTDPQVLLHVFGIFLSLSKAEILPCSPDEVVSQAKAVIDALEKEQRLPTDLARRFWRYDLSYESTFGLGYQQCQTEEFKKTLGYLGEALERAFRDANPSRVEDLMKLAESDPNVLYRALAGGYAQQGMPDYSDDPILLDYDPEAFANWVFCRPPDHWRYLLGALEERIARQEATAAHRGGGRPTEADWAQKMRAEALALAAASSPIRRAQIKGAVQAYLGFLDKAERLG